MKKQLLILCVILSFSVPVLNGQYFTGGNIQINNSSSKTEYQTNLTQSSKSFAITLSPEFGKFLNEKLAIGLYLNFQYHSDKNGTDLVVTEITKGIGLTPFIRYYAWSWNKFSVFSEAYTGAEFSKKTNKTGNNPTNGPRWLRYYFGFSPGLAYNLNDNLSFQTNLNFLNLSCSFTTIKDGSLIVKNSNVIFGTGLDDILSVGNVTIGAIYKF
jgi:hypothetical protein